MNFGKKLKHVRVDILGLTQAELAASIGTAQATINAIENGVNKEPSFTLFCNLVVKHNLNPFYFITDSRNEPEVLAKSNTRLDSALLKLKKYEDLFDQMQKIKEGRK